MTHDDDWLVRALRAHEPRLDDDGFTQRVMAALPPVPAPRRARADWIVLLRSEIPEARIEVLKQSGRRLVFDGDRLAVFVPLGRGYTPSTSRME